MASTSENLLLEKRLNIAAWVVTGAVLLLVGLMRRVKIPLPEGVNVDFLPPFHATMNACTAIVLLLAYYFILEKKVEAHRKAIYVAVVLSVLFLLSYVAYHFTTPETIYGDIDKDGMLSEVERSAAGTGRTVYLVVLLSHIEIGRAHV